MGGVRKEKGSDSQISFLNSEQRDHEQFQDEIFGKMPQGKHVRKCRRGQIYNYPY